MPSSPTYHEFNPGPRLSDAVACFWTGTMGRNPESSHYRVLPDGCMDILFDFGGTTGARVSVIGPMSRSYTFTSRGPIDFLGVRFRPGALPGLIAADAAELADQQADLAEFWGRRVDESWHALAERAPPTRIRLLHDILVAHGTVPRDPFVAHCVSRLETSSGALRIVDLETSTGLSGRQLERKFARHVGLPPKTFARIARFKAAVAAAEASAGPPDWARLAFEFGFADQSHLVREFKAFSSLSPVELMRDSDGPTSDVGFLQDVSGPNVGSSRRTHVPGP